VDALEEEPGRGTDIFRPPVLLDFQMAKVSFSREMIDKDFLNPFAHLLGHDCRSSFLKGGYSLEHLV
jgi:hypothetical protein